MHTPAKIPYAIIENDENTIRMLEFELKQIGDYFVQRGVHRCFKEGFNSALRLQPKVLFINIQFPFFTGAELFGSATFKNIDFVFLANKDNYIYQNIKSSRFDCLIKPISQIELKRTLKRKIEAYYHQRISQPYTFHLPASTEYKFKKITFPTSSGYIFLNPDEILYCVADEEYTHVITNSGKYLISKNLKYFETKLNPKRFIRAHKSYLINIDHIRQYHRTEGGKVIMSDEKEIHIGRSKKTDFSHLLGI